MLITSRKVWKNPNYRGLLIWLWEFGGSNPTSIVKYFGYSRVQLMKILKSFIELKYVKKTPRWEDKSKFVIYEITEGGKLFLKNHDYFVTEKRRLDGRNPN
jgi:DNA-binding MarR family transcriptional regulator